MEHKERHVIVTTEYRGVYFGYLEEQEGRECILTDARMCLYWASGGVDRLAQVGPCAGDRLATPAPRIWLCGLTSVVDCTPEAVRSWHEWKD